MPSLLSIKDAYQVAESLARADLMTSPSARRRLQARRIELGLGEHPGFVPPKHLLLYLVRMGSLSFSPQIRNKDTEDDDLDLPLRMTKEELLSFCSKELEGTPQLIPRRFRENFLSSDFKSQEYYPPMADKSGIRVLQWNVLSQSLGVKTDKFDCCPDEALKWRRRRNLLTQEIIKYSPDVICLQEVDHFKYLQKTLGSQGYVGYFAPKVDSPCYYIEDNNGPDGCAIFYFADKFELVNTENRVLQVWGVHSNQLALLTNLRNRFTGKEFCVATTHLKARQGALLSTLRNEQGKDLLEFVKSKSEGRPVVLAGDFNAEPSEPVYATLTTDEELHLGSAYAGPGGEPPYTTWKIREEGEICHTIDYIFYSRNKLRVGDVLEFPSDEEIGKDRVPSLTYPSDHFSLVSDLYPLSITSPL